MKQIILIILSLLIFTSCSLMPNNGDDNSNNNVEQEYNIDLTSLKMDEKYGVIASSIEHIADISAFKTAAEVDSFVSSPHVCFDGDYTYLVRSFPEEFRDANSFYNFIDAGNFLNQIEVYITGNYSEPVKIIELSGYNFTRLAYSSISYYKNNFYIIGSTYNNNESTTIIAIFNEKGEMLSSHELPFSTTTPHYIVDGNIYALLRSNMHKYTLNSNDSYDDNIIDESVESIFNSNNIIYYIKKDTTPENDVVYNLYYYKNDSIEQIQQIKIDEEINNAAYDSSSGVFYYSNYTDIFAYKNGKSIKIISTADTFTDVYSLHNSMLIARVGHNQMSLYSLPSEPVSAENDTYIIRVCAPYSDANYLENNYNYTTNFMRINGLPIRFETTYFTGDMDEYINTMAKKLMAGDDDFDIFVVDTYMTELLKKKYYENLGEYEILNSYFNKMIPGLSDICSIDEKTALVPTNISVQSIEYDKSMNINQPNNFDELLNAVNENNNYLLSETNEYNLIYPWIKELISNYMADNINREALENDIKKLFEFADNASKSDAIYIGNDANSKGKFIKIFDNYTEFEVENNENIEINSILKLSENQKYSVNCDWLAINPMSPHKDISVAFFAYYMESCVRDYYLYTNRVRYFDTAISKLDNGVENKYTEIFKKQISDGIRAVNDSNLNYKIHEGLNNYISGAATLDDSVEEIVRVIRMMRDE